MLGLYLGGDQYFMCSLFNGNYSMILFALLLMITFYSSILIFSNLFSSLNIVRVIKSRRMRWAGHVVCMGEGRGVYRVLVGRPEGKRPLGRPGHTWEDNIKLHLREIEIDGVNWM
jgi:hypothetical protein